MSDGIHTPIYSATFFGGASSQFDIIYTEALSITLRGAETDVLIITDSEGYYDK